MKNKLWLIAIIALVGFFMTACGDLEEEEGLGSGTEDDPYKLTAGDWAENTLADANSEVWYSFEVQNGTTYYVWVQDYFSGILTGYADILISAKYLGGAAIFTGSEAGTGNNTNATANTPKSDFTANQSGTVLLRVHPVTGSLAKYGQFKVTFTTTPTRPAYDGPNGTKEKPYQLTADTWLQGNLTTTKTEFWYSFSVVQDQTYNFWLRDFNSKNTPSSAGYAYVILSAEYLSGGKVSGTGDGKNDGTDSTVLNFTAPDIGTVLVNISADSTAAVKQGLFKVALTTSNSRPAGE